MPADFHQDLADALDRFFVSTGNIQRPAKAGQRLFGLTAVAEDDGHVMMGFGPIRTDLKRAFTPCQGVVQVPRPAIDVGKIVMRRCIVGTLLQGHLIAGCRAGQIAGGEQHKPQIIMPTA